MQAHAAFETSTPIEIEGYSYRTSSRFGSRVWLSLTPDTVSVTGPRVSKSLYCYWIGVQLFFLAAFIGFIILAIVLLNAGWLWLALLSLGLHGIAGGVGAGCLWEMANLIAFGENRRGDTVSFARNSVRRVSIGSGWGRRGMKLLLLPYFALMAKSTSTNVSFEGPDGTDAQGVYAIHMRTMEDAKNLARLLQAD